MALHWEPLEGTDKVRGCAFKIQALRSMSGLVRIEGKKICRMKKPP